VYCFRAVRAPPRSLKYPAGNADSREVRLHARADRRHGASYRLTVIAAAAGTGTMLAALVHRPQLSPGAVLALTVLLVAAAVAVVVTGRNQFAEQVRLLAPAATLIAVLLVRHGASGDRIRYELLLLLPVLWLALQGSRGELVVGIVGITAGLTLLNATADNASAWTDELLFGLVATTLGAIVHRLVGQVRRQTTDMASVTRVVRDVASAADADGARAIVCRAALEIVDAQIAILLEPDGADQLRVAAAWGTDMAAGTKVPIGGIDGDLRAALSTGDQRFLADDGGPLCCAAIGARSALITPVMRDAATAGALVVGWSRSVRRITPRMAEVVELFAVETARAIERGDLIAQVREHADDLQAVVQVARRLPRNADAQSARDAICQGVLEVCDGMLAVLMEPDGAGNLVSTAVAGADVAPIRVSLDAEDSATVDVFRALEPFYVADLRDHSDVSQRLVDATGAVSALWQPVVGDGAPVGVLVVSWQHRLPRLSNRSAAVVGLFAAEAAVAIERADLLARMEGLNRMLAVQVEALRVSDQLKSDFVSSVSHELRTPLASILGYLDVLIEGELGPMPDDQTEFLKIVDENARRLLALISDLLTLSGLESGKMLLRHQQLDLRELLERHLSEQSGAIRDRRLLSTLDMPLEPVTAQVDPERIGQVISNVLANAVKFTPEGGEVRVGLHREAERAVLEITDTGIGISERDVDQLFERFFRARNATDAAIPGTGLGLAICKGIVDAHGGSISVASQLDRGTTIRINLPTTITAH
jgi:two-component system phosphate regulon sensor histidine kinase PhoR